MARSKSMAFPVHRRMVQLPDNAMDFLDLDDDGPDLGPMR